MLTVFAIAFILMQTQGEIRPILPHEDIALRYATTEEMKEYFSGNSFKLVGLVDDIKKLRPATKIVISDTYYPLTLRTEDNQDDEYMTLAINDFLLASNTKYFDRLPPKTAACLVALKSNKFKTRDVATDLAIKRKDLTAVYVGLKSKNLETRVRAQRIFDEIIKAKPYPVFVKDEKRK